MKINQGDWVIVNLRGYQIGLVDTVVPTLAWEGQTVVVYEVDLGHGNPEVLTQSEIIAVLLAVKPEESIDG